jgi:hypothetical protein
MFDSNVGKDKLLRVKLGTGKAIKVGCRAGWWEELYEDWLNVMAGMEYMERMETTCLTPFHLFHYSH